MMLIEGLWISLWISLVTQGGDVLQGLPHKGDFFSLVNGEGMSLILCNLIMYYNNDLHKSV